jgi:hypothetical protein
MGLAYIGRVLSRGSWKASWAEEGAYGLSALGIYYLIQEQRGELGILPN